MRQGRRVEDGWQLRWQCSWDSEEREVSTNWRRVGRECCVEEVELTAGHQRAGGPRSEEVPLDGEGAGGIGDEQGLGIGSEVGGGGGACIRVWKVGTQWLFVRSVSAL